jgi:hypothetical protein
MCLREMRNGRSVDSFGGREQSSSFRSDAEPVVGRALRGPVGIEPE